MLGLGAGRAGKKGTAILMYTQRDRRTVVQLERIAGVKFETIAGPTPEAVVSASVTAATSVIQSVSPEVLPYFMNGAKELLASDVRPHPPFPPLLFSPLQHVLRGGLGGCAVLCGGDVCEGRFEARLRETARLFTRSDEIERWEIKLRQNSRDKA
eukprot:856363-Prorocentrum_minimum.AAC.1